MKDDDDIKHYSPDDLKRMKAQGDYVPTRKDAPAYAVDDAFWDKARVVMPPPRKVHTGIRFDADLLDWFKAQGKGWQTRMNAVLRSYMEAHRDNTHHYDKP